MGLAYISSDENPRIIITEAGKQVMVILSDLPNAVKLIPYFLIELLCRFQLNNPARPKTSKDSEYDKELKESTVFPYFTIFKLFRCCENYLTIEELRRIIFKIKDSSEIEDAIQSIKELRIDRKSEKTEAEIDTKYGEIPETDNTRYIMGHLGASKNSGLSIVKKQGPSTFLLNEDFVPFIDRILSDPPIFQDDLSESTWMEKYGAVVNPDKIFCPPLGGDEIEDRSENGGDILCELDEKMVRYIGGYELIKENGLYCLKDVEDVESWPKSGILYYHDKMLKESLLRLDRVEENGSGGHVLFFDLGRPVQSDLLLKLLKE
jgi:hypothetical protein